MQLKLTDRIKVEVMGVLLSLAIRFIGATTRIKEYGELQLTPRGKKRGNPAIFAYWHSRLIMPLWYYRNKRICHLSSDNMENEYVVSTTKRLGFSAVRGSSTRGGLRALFDLKKVMQEEERDTAITPDGPRGPKQKVQLGTVFLAKMTGFPIVPFSFDTSRKKVLKTWDGLLIPLPFGKGAFVWGKEIFVPRDADDKLMEEKRLELEIELNRLNDEAAKLCR